MTLTINTLPNIIFIDFRPYLEQRKSTVPEFNGMGQNDKLKSYCKALNLKNGKKDLDIDKLFGFFKYHNVENCYETIEYCKYDVLALEEIDNQLTVLDTKQQLAKICGTSLYDSFSMTIAQLVGFNLV
jgi:SNF2 family DNA or RNA helicase